MLLKLGMLNFYLRDRNCNSQNDIVIPQYLSYHTRAHTHIYIYIICEEMKESFIFLKIKESIH